MNTYKLRKDEIVLAALASGEDNLYTPVQVQKMFFLIDRNIGSRLGGPFFDFRPYHYGPFDSQVYRELENLYEDGFVEIISNNSAQWKMYKLSKEGHHEGNEILQGLDPNFRDYLFALNRFITETSFEQLVSSIYSAYPEMRANSIFNK